MRFYRVAFLAALLCALLAAPAPSLARDGDVHAPQAHRRPVASGSVVGEIRLPGSRGPAPGVSVLPYAINQPFPGADNDLWFSGGRVLARSRPRVVTDGLGRFEVTGLPAGEYHLAVLPNGAWSGRSGRRPAGARAAVERYRFAAPVEAGPVRVAAGRKTKLPPVTLGQGGVLRGSARSAAQRPIKGGFVSALPEEAFPANVLPALSASTARTDARGEFVLAGLPPGRYSAALAAPGCGGATKLHVAVAAGKETRVTLMARPKR